MPKLVYFWIGAVYALEADSMQSTIRLNNYLRKETTRKGIEGIFTCTDALTFDLILPPDA